MNIKTVLVFIGLKIMELIGIPVFIFCLGYLAKIKWVADWLKMQPPVSVTQQLQAGVFVGIVLISFALFCCLLWVVLEANWDMAKRIVAKTKK
jgi:hypothetical protein